MAGFVKVIEALSQNLAASTSRGELVFSRYHFSSSTCFVFTIPVITVDLSELSHMFIHIPASRDVS
jgi:hypothetical protein